MPFPTHLIQQTSLDNILTKKSIGSMKAKPFLKWAGGKGQLLEQFEHYYPKQLKEGKISNYYEPFVGGGAVFFRVVQNYDISNAYLCDLNHELILTYQVIQRDVDDLIELLRSFAKRFSKMSALQRKSYYYKIRDQYNKQLNVGKTTKYNPDWVYRAAWMLFLNKTCYNGLFRVNKKGEFNVPYGHYKNPQIIDVTNMKRVSKLLKNANISVGDYESLGEKVNDYSFVYFDPPYRPISRTSSFTSYSTFSFDDTEQTRLAKFFDKLSRRKIFLMLSNSDPKNNDPHDNFFENIYENHYINRVRATRMINCNGNSRGAINELLITNYQVASHKFNGNSK